MSDSPFALAAPTLIGMGYSPMPVAPRCDPQFENHRPPTGKEPGRLNGQGRWKRLKGWTVFCKRQLRPEIIASWSSWPDAGVCVATGFNCLVAIDIDRDEIVDPILDVLPPVYVAKRGRKGLTAFYRAAEQLPSTNYKDADKRGLLDFLSVGKQTVIPGTIHPDTGRPYEWTTERTLLNTPLKSLPVFTQAHREAMEEVLRRFGWDALEPTVARSKAVSERPVRAQSTSTGNAGGWYDNFKREVNAAMRQWVPKLGLHRLQEVSGGWVSVASFRPSGSGKPLHKRNQNLSIRNDGKIRDHAVDPGEGGYNAISLVAVCLFGNRKNTSDAIAWLRNEIGFDDEPPAAPDHPVEPTYADNRVSLDEATTELCGVLDAFETQMLEWRTYRAQALIDPSADDRKPPVWGVGIETSGGKTYRSNRKVAACLYRGWTLDYVVPRIDLAEKVASSLRAQGVDARVFRGRKQDDPAAPGKQMCQNLKAVEVAEKLSVSIRPAVCERNNARGNGGRCPFFECCGYEQQGKTSPDIWIIPSATLLYEKPDFMPESDGIVFDEKFHPNAIGAISRPFEIDVHVLRDSKIAKIYKDDEYDFLTDMRWRLRDAIKDNGHGPLSRAVLIDAGFSAADAKRAAGLEHRRATHAVLRPTMGERDRMAAVRHHETPHKLARAAGALWEEIARSLESDHPQSGRVKVEGSKVTVTPLQTVHSSWRAPALVLDATLTTPEIIAAAMFGDETSDSPSTVTVKADISIRWPSCVHVRQVLGAKVSKKALGIVGQAETEPSNAVKATGEHPKVGDHANERNIIRFIRQRAALAYPDKVGVISYLGLRERIEGEFSENVKWMHFGATSGLNDFETFVGLIVIGQWWVPPAKVEAQASVFAGYPISPLGEFYPKRDGGIRLAGGSTVPAKIEYHPDPFAEAVRRGITEDELLQAIGRLRGPRRIDRCFLDILSDVVLPITVNEVAQWKAVCPGVEADMMEKGVVLTNYRDAELVFEFTKWGVQAAKTDLVSLLCTPTEKPGQFSPIRGFTYRKEGARGPQSKGYVLPAIIAKPEALDPELETAVRAFLRPKLGSLSSIEFERLRVKESAAAQAMLAKMWRQSPFSKTMRTLSEMSTRIGMSARMTKPLLGFRSLGKMIETANAALAEAGDSGEERDKAEAVAESSATDDHSRDDAH